MPELGPMPQRTPAIASDRLADDDYAVDLLIDGELDPPSVDDLLARLDAVEDGWKRCALGLLSARSIKRTSLTPVEAAVEPAGTATKTPAARTTAGIGIAVVAVVLAFLAGAVSNRIPVATVSPDPAATHVVARPEQLHAPSPRAWLASDAMLFEDSVPVVFQRRQTGDLWSYSTHHQMPPFMLQAIRDAGHDVRFREEQVDVTLDGRTQKIPVLETRITPRIEHNL